MRRRLCVPVLSVLVVLSTLLTGCHGTKGPDPFEIPEAMDESRKYEITFWAKNDTNKTQTDIYKKAITDFEALYPQITVNMKLYTDYSRIYNDVITNISTNTTPNVCITYPDHIATYLTGSNTVVPLDELIDDGNFGLGGSKLKFDGPTKEEIIPEYLEECNFKDHYYALPFMRSTEACYINEDYVHALGYELPDILTWDYIWEVSEAALAKNPDGTFVLNNQNVMIPFIYKSTDNMTISYLKQTGAGYSDSDANIEMFNDTCSDFLLEIAKHARSGAFSTFKISSYPANFLNAGQCVFAIDSTAGSTWMGADAPLSDIDSDAYVGFNTAVRMIPQANVSKPYMMSQGPSVCVFNKDDDGEVLASWLFAQYLLSNDVQTAYAETEGYIPVTSKAQHSEEYTEYLSLSGSDNDEHYYVKIDATKLLLNNTDNTFVTPVFNGSASLRDAASALVENVTKMERRHSEVTEDAVATIFDDVKQLYRLDQVYSDTVEREELGPLPKTSVILIASIAAVWCVIIIIYIIGKVRKMVADKKRLLHKYTNRL